MSAEKLSVTLPAEMVQAIRAAVSAGTYSSDSEVIREAMRLWQDRSSEREHRLNVIRAKIHEAINDPARITAAELRDHFDRLTDAAEKRKGS